MSAHSITAHRNRVVAPSIWRELFIGNIYSKFSFSSFLGIDFALFSLEFRSVSWLCGQSKTLYFFFFVFCFSSTIPTRAWHVFTLCSRFAITWIEKRLYKNFPVSRLTRFAFPFRHIFRPRFNLLFIEFVCLFDVDNTILCALRCTRVYGRRERHEHSQCYWIDRNGIIFIVIVRCTGGPATSRKKIVFLFCAIDSQLVERFEVYFRFIEFMFCELEFRYLISLNSVLGSLGNTAICRWQHTHTTLMHNLPRIFGPLNSTHTSADASVWQLKDFVISVAVWR